MVARDTKANTGYRWKDKDPIIDAVRAAIENSQKSITRIATDANVATSTIHNWDKGNVRKPQHATLRSVMEACGYHERWVNTDKALIVNYVHVRGAPSFKIVKIN